MLDPATGRNLDAAALEREARRTRAVVGWIAVAFLLLAGFSVASEAYVASFGPPGMGVPTARDRFADGLYRAGDTVAFTLPFLALLASVFAVPLLLVFATAAPRGRLRVARTGLAGVYVAGFGALLASNAPRDALRSHRIAGAAERMEPLVSALEAYRADHGGRPPARLDHLVPRYLPSIAGFGVRGCRGLKYSPGGPAYRLEMECPNGWALDRFEYPFRERWGEGRSYERLPGGWAYFWD